MESIRDLIAGWKKTVMAGDPVGAAEHIAAFYRNLSSAEQIGARGHLGNSHREVFPDDRPLLAGERTAIVALVGHIMNVTAAELPAAQDHAGGGWVVTALNDRVGLHPLEIAIAPGAKHEKPAGRVDETSDKAYELGVRQALYYLHDAGLGSLGFAMVLNHYGAIGKLPTFSVGDTTNQLRGGSLGLAVALTSLSAFLDVPPSPEFVATGTLDDLPEGRVGDVAGLVKKLKVARAVGLKLIFPDANKGNEDSDTSLQPSEYAVPVRTFRDAVSLVFKPNAVEAGVKKLAESHLPKDLRTRWTQREPKEGGVLISPVGSEDPFSAGRIDGPVLSIERRWHPKRALLLHTPDFAAKADATCAELNALGCRAETRVIDTSDPTDFNVLLNGFRDKLVEYRSSANVQAGDICMSNVSSGTPQMQMAMHLLVERGFLPDIRLQTVAPHHAHGGERVKQVTLQVHR